MTSVYTQWPPRDIYLFFSKVSSPPYWISFIRSLTCSQVRLIIRKHKKYWFWMILRWPCPWHSYVNVQTINFHVWQDEEEHDFNVNKHNYFLWLVESCLKIIFFWKKITSSWRTIVLEKRERQREREKKKKKKKKQNRQCTSFFFLPFLFHVRTSLFSNWTNTYTQFPSHRQQSSKLKKMLKNKDWHIEQLWYPISIFSSSNNNLIIIIRRNYVFTQWVSLKHVHLLI